MGKLSRPLPLLSFIVFIRWPVSSRALAALSWF